MKNLLFFLFLFINFNAFSQSVFEFIQPLKVRVKVDVKKIAKKDDIIFLKKIQDVSIVASDGVPLGFKTCLIGFVNNRDSVNISISQTDISDFLDKYEFVELNTVDDIWEASLIVNNTYQNLFKNGYQLDYRNKLFKDCEEIYNGLNDNNAFFNDAYFEDYLTSLLLKIQPSKNLLLERPGNLFIKILISPDLNAMCFPNGCILITTGILSTIKSEDELIGILAHEVAHFYLDHHVVNYNVKVDREKRAAFWSTISTLAAATVDVILSSNNEFYVPGVLTKAVAYASILTSELVLDRLGTKFNQKQELDADYLAKRILPILNYNKFGISVALSRLKQRYISNGEFYALSSSGTHPSLNFRIHELGESSNINSFTQPTYLVKASKINSLAAQTEFLKNNFETSIEIANRNISNDVAIETDYLIKSISKRKIDNTIESNNECLGLLNKAKSINVNYNILISKEESLINIRLNKKIEAKKCLNTYIDNINKILFDNPNKSNDRLINNQLEAEIEWAKIMLIKLDKI
jgi:predicted Zn-dependent protease